MAFGTFFKKIMTGAKNIVDNALPVIRKGVSTVAKVAPMIAKGASAFGGPIGTAIGTAASTVGSIANAVDNVLNKQGKFDIPLLK